MPDASTIIIGGGASGALVAAFLLQHSADRRVTLIEPRETLGTGEAYSTHYPVHLLNVPAGRMSAIADEPQHFLNWLKSSHPSYAAADVFAPRMLYGEYLSQILAQARAGAGDRFSHVRRLAEGASVSTDCVRVRCSDGMLLEASTLVVACGNAAPATLRAIDSRLSDDGRVFGSAWEEDALKPRRPDETVLLIGTGLTAVDAVLALRYNGHRGHIFMVSRRGLLPHEHRLFDAPPQNAGDKHLQDDLLEVSRAVRIAGRTGRWRQTIDGLRPSANRLWQSFTVDEQSRFMRHVLPYWNVHRHRLAPSVVKTLAELIAAGTLQNIAGRVAAIEAAQSGLSIPVKLRGGPEAIVLHADRVINCTGPAHDLSRVGNPLLQSLMAQGVMVPTAIHAGIRTAEDGALIDEHGVASKRVFAIGPVRFGQLIETTAIPEIRVQARELASTIVGSRHAGALAQS